MIALDTITGFNWDEGNARKNEKHGVSQSDAEKVFFNRSIVVADDRKYAHKEHRWHALGVTDTGRRLHITFTVRGTFIRVISARDMHKKERKLYEQTA